MKIFCCILNIIFKINAIYFLLYQLYKTNNIPTEISQPYPQI